MNSTFLIVACFDALLMLIWFKSDAFVEWMKLFGFRNLIKYDEYVDFKIGNSSMTYPLFLKLKYPKFIFKIIGCPLCSCIWMSLFPSILLSAGIASGLLAFIIDTMLYGSVLCILTLFIYGCISKLLNENK